MAKQSFNFQAHLSRHAHNVSAGYTSSLVTGPIVPQYFDMLQPGETLYFTPKLFARLQDIVSPFFGEVDVHLDAFFVPLNMIYTIAGQVFTQTNDVLSSHFVNGSTPNKEAYPLLNTSVWHENVNLRSTRFGHYECRGKELMRLIDSLDCNAFSVLSGSNLDSTSEEVIPRIQDIDNIPSVVSPWMFAAYQAIYQKFYRNDDVETFDISSYNIDQYYNVASFSNSEFVVLRYCQRPNDYFTSVKVSPIASAVNKFGSYRATDSESLSGGSYPLDGGSLDSLLIKVNDWLGTQSESSKYFGRSESDSDFNYVAQSGNTRPSFETAGHASATNANTAANIRTLFAVDKFLRIYGRAGKTYDEQVLAHFGIKVPHDVKHDLTHIKHWKMSLMAEPVYSTADIGGGSSLGQVGGQSNNTLQAKQEKFTAPVHGIFMIVAYANTKPRYFGTFSKLHLLSERLAFPIPEFDKLGVQPLWGFEVYPSFLQDAVGEAVNNVNNKVRIGWQRRYCEFKQKYNRVSPLYIDTNLTGDISTESNKFSTYVLSRLPFSEDALFSKRGGVYDAGKSALIPATELFETPNSLNGVMAVSYSGNWSDDYWNAPQLVFDTDPIIMDFYCDAKKVSWMSELGEPDL